MAALIQFASGAPGIKYRLDTRYITIGRESQDNTICLPCAFVSKYHAHVELIERIDAPGEYDYYLEDLGSTNHTYLNDKPIERAQLSHGDVIRIGKTTLKFDISGEQPRLSPLDINLELPPVSHSGTWNFSRRLSVIGQGES